jgi:hypothetical protein
MYFGLDTDMENDKEDLERYKYGVLLAVLALFAVQLLLNRQ